MNSPDGWHADIDAHTLTEYTRPVDGAYRSVRVLEGDDEVFEPTSGASFRVSDLVGDNP